MGSKVPTPAPKGDPLKAKPPAPMSPPPPPKSYDCGSFVTITACPHCGKKLKEKAL